MRGTKDASGAHMPQHLLLSSRSRVLWGPVGAGHPRLGGGAGVLAWAGGGGRGPQVKGGGLAKRTRGEGEILVRRKGCCGGEDES